MPFSLGRWAASGTAIALLLSGTACGTSPTKSVTDMDSGSITAGGISVQEFGTSTSGDIVVTLVSLSQPVSIEISLGTFVGGGCSVAVQDAGITAGTVWTNAVSSPGTYCVVLDDTATPNAPPTLNYTLTIQHPQ
jgi:hypothetical protein